MTINRPASKIADFTAESRIFEKIADEVAERLEEIIMECADAPDYDSEEFDATMTYFQNWVANHLGRIAD